MKRILSKYLFGAFLAGSALCSFETKADFEPCYLVVSGHDWGYSREFNHENAHCWGWEDDGSIDPPFFFSLTVLGIYPNINYPCGKKCSYAEAKKYCSDHSACQWNLVNQGRGIKK